MFDKRSTQSAPAVLIQGTVQRVLHFAAATKFAVLSVRTKDNPGLKVVGVVGSSTVSEGDEIECSGTHLTDPKFGPQFKTELILPVPPRTIAGIERYLGSGVIPGIGPKLAKRLVEAFGENTIEVIDTAPDRLLSLPGIGPAKVQALRDAWEETRDLRNTMLFLQSFGVTPALAARIHKFYGKNTIPYLQEDPYRLTRDIAGIGFRTADRMAREYGVPMDSPKRLRAGIVYAMQERRSAGHCAAPFETLLSDASGHLGDPEAGEIPRELLVQAIQKCIETGELVDEPDGAGIFLAALRRAEISVAESINDLLLGGRMRWKPEKAYAIRVAQEQTGLTLSPSQQEALYTALTSKVAILTGGPGTGKTTILKGILGVVLNSKAKVLLCAPTGRAAKRMTESTGLEAVTIHRLLGFNPSQGGFQKNEDDPLEADLVVVDEASMVDINLMASLLCAIPPEAALLIVGDVDQLPSVGPGAVLSDIIASGVVPTVRLTEIHRQAKNSLIIQGAHEVNHGRIPTSGAKDDPKADFFLVNKETPEEITAELLRIVTKVVPERYGYDPMRDIQVLTPMRKNALGATALNEELRKLLNPNGQPRISRFTQTYAVGDKVQQTVNNYKKEVFNGDLGTVTAIDLEAGKVSVTFDGTPVVYNQDELDDLVLAYATTIHKSQGSEYPVVVMPLANQHYMLLDRSLLYTAITRGKKLVIIIHQQRALQTAVRNQNSRKRLTGLTERLKTYDIFN